MSLFAAVGQSLHIDSQQAGIQAVEQALGQLGRAQAAFGWVVASHLHAMDSVLAGIVAALGDAPLLGFSSSAVLTNAGRERRSVAVALLSGDNLEGRAGWWPDYVKDGQEALKEMLRSLQPNVHAQESLLFVADGLSGDATLLSETLSAGGYALAGCLAGGDMARARSFQLGGRRGGSGGLAAAVLSGDIVIGVGAAHGWQPAGAAVQLSKVQGLWVRALDGQLPSETYAKHFGYPARDWTFPPLNELVRQYPLGLTQGDGQVVRSPMRIEADGSLRMNTPLPEGEFAALMVGSRETCLQAARQAARQALKALGRVRPRLALVLADVAYLTMLETSPLGEVEALRQELGGDVPILGGYTLGQIMSPSAEGADCLLNQHIEIVLFGEKTVDVEEIIT